jgi:hypothetical protein
MLCNLLLRRWAATLHAVAGDKSNKKTACRGRTPHLWVLAEAQDLAEVGDRLLPQDLGVADVAPHDLRWIPLLRDEETA